MPFHGVVSPVADPVRASRRASCNGSGSCAAAPQHKRDRLKPQEVCDLGLAIHHAELVVELGIEADGAGAGEEEYEVGRGVEHR